MYTSVRQMVKDIEGIDRQFFNVKVFDALVLRKVLSRVLFVADLAHDHDFRTVPLYMFIQLSARHVLELISITNVAPELRTVELCVNLQLTEGLPNDLALPIRSWTSMRELTKVDTVL